MINLDARRRQEQLTRRLSLFLSGMVCLLLLGMLLAERLSESEIIIRMVGAILASAFLYRFLTRKDPVAGCTSGTTAFRFLRNNSLE